MHAKNFTLFSIQAMANNHFNGFIFCYSSLTLPANLFGLSSNIQKKVS